MKTLLLLILLAIASGSSAQSPILSDTAVTNFVIDVKKNLRLSHSQYSTGTTFVVIGSITTISSSILVKNDKARNALIIGGGVLTIIGAIIQIDAHKYFGRLGRWKVEGNGIAYNFR
jgi:hypothetical protein